MPKNNDLIKKAYDFGKEYEMKYRSCCQCTLGALQDAFNLQEDVLFRATTGFGGGIGHCGDSACGGYSGGVLFLGQLIGRERKDFKEKSSSSTGIFPVVKKFHDKFLQEYGSVTCRKIQEKIFGKPFDLWDDIDKKLFDQMGAHTDKCTGVVAKASAWMAQLILDNNELIRINK